jgi:hypothetical protein
MSLLQHYSQRKTNSFIVALSEAVFLLQPAQLAQWASDNKSILTVVGSTYTTSVVNFRGLVNNVDNGLFTDKYYSFPVTALVPGTTLKDLGKDVYIGTNAASNLLHLRLVELPGTVEHAGENGTVGYIPIEANADIFSEYPPVTYPCVGVARV